MDEGLNFGSSNQLGDFWGKIEIKLYFSRGKGGPYVDELEGELGRKMSIILKVAWWEEIWRCWEIDKSTMLYFNV
jgi:hypothetical protein